MVCGSPVVASANLLRRLAGECDHVVAVDRGLDALLGAGLGCDVYVGDADTVSLLMMRRCRHPWVLWRIITTVV